MNKINMRVGKVFLFLFIFVFIGSLVLGVFNEREQIQVKLDKGEVLNGAAGNNYLHWYKTWGGVNWDFGYAMARDAAGNIYVTGYTQSYGAGNQDVALVKFAPNGTKLWNTTWGGASAEMGYGVALDTARNIYVVGETRSYGAGSQDLALVKFAPNGTKLWNTTWGYAGNDLGVGVALDTTGNIYCVGSTFVSVTYDLALVKFYPNGTVAWSKTWGGGNDDIGRAVSVSANGSIYCTGFTTSSSQDLALVKFYPNGTVAWSATWGSINNDRGMGVSLDNLENIYVVGYTDKGLGNLDLALVKFYPNGTRVWNNTWGGADQDYGSDIALDSSGYIYCTGYTGSFGSALALVSFYPNGTKFWNTTLGSSTGDGIVVDAIGNIYCAGYTSVHDLVLAKFNYNDADPPTSNEPGDATYVLNTKNKTINWTLSDNLAGGCFRVFRNASVIIPWTVWTSGENLEISINEDIDLGVYSYVIHFNDSVGLYGVPDTVIITIELEESPIPGFGLLLIAFTLFAAVYLFSRWRKFNHKTFY
jgi:uncharacterized delta-60 repeat protein